MQLYAGRTREFVHAATHNAIARRLADAFLAHYRHAAGEAEFHSWQNSLRALSSVIEIGGPDRPRIIAVLVLTLA